VKPLSARRDARELEGMASVVVGSSDGVSR
jgi:hypothetical protein